MLDKEGILKYTSLNWLLQRAVSIERIDIVATVISLSDYHASSRTRWLKYVKRW